MQNELNCYQWGREGIDRQHGELTTMTPCRREGGRESERDRQRERGRKWVRWTDVQTKIATERGATKGARQREVSSTRGSSAERERASDRRGTQLSERDSRPREGNAGRESKWRFNFLDSRFPNFTLFIFLFSMPKKSVLVPI